MPAKDKLTDARIRALKPKTASYKIADGAGLYIEVTPQGSKLWRLKYRFAGRESRLGLGTYPDLSLAAARKARDRARAQLAEGRNPAEARREERAAAAAPDRSFAAVAMRWLADVGPSWVPLHRDRIEGRLRKHAFPDIGSRTLADITPGDVLTIVRRIHARGHEDLAQRMRQTLDAVFCWAIANQLTNRNPASDVRGAVKRTKRGDEQHFPVMKDPKELGQLLRDLRDYRGEAVVTYALRVLPLLACRPGELRNLRWADVDFTKKRITIPASRMKARREHVIPLSRQALALLRELKELTGTRSEYVFVGLKSTKRPISDMTLNSALRRLGYSREQLVSHSFRAIFSTFSNEAQWPADAIELQLAHVDSSVRGAYHRGAHLEVRTELMQWWADRLDAMTNGDDGNVVPMKRRKA